jgi:hypothetical protein
MSDLATRLDRVESTQAIQQLPIRYAVAVDSRDTDAWLMLFAPDIDCGRRGVGRDALRSFIEPLLADFYRTAHLICGHMIDFQDANHATGRVYCRAEHEYGDQWIVQAICYFDTYERIDGAWYFRRREEDFWYSADLLERPQQADFTRWPGAAPKFMPKMMVDRFQSWRDYWAKCAPEKINAATSKP